MRFGRARFVAAEVGVGGLVSGFLIGGAFAPVLVTIGAAALLLGFARWDGAWLTDHLTAMLRRSGASGDRLMVGGSKAAVGECGALTHVIPGLHVVQRVTRNGPALGIAGDGQGFAAVVELRESGALRVDLAQLASHVADDPAELAGVQVLVEQFAALPTTGRPLARRTFVVLRHEPMWAPEAVQRRGGGADGARAALVAAVARLRLRLSDAGVGTTTLGRDEFLALLRTLGDPSPTAELSRDAWVTPAGAHCCLAASVSSSEDWSRLLHAAGAGPADRSVVSVAVDLDGRVTQTRSAVRVVATDHRRAAEARSLLLDTGLTVALSLEQATGVVATLPLGGGARPLASAIGLVNG
ncbi:MAG: type VII secretion protein EccE [Pseudonocardiales bacterium]